MAYLKTLFDDNFLEYASYVIKDRAIPNLEDGLKPVQRRILHTLITVDDGRFHKVANIVGATMKYHPHGDASIYSALVVLANKELLIDRQGNFGNIYTGDGASAARYIECRLLPIAKKILHSPEITEWVDSYDSRNREPVTFPAKLPLILILGAEGIAVGMATKILPHNIGEVMDAMQKSLRGEKFKLYPDFITGGYLDVSDYQDGNGKILTRAKFNVSNDGKRIIIKELPFGVTTETLIASIKAATDKGKIKVSDITDFTSENVEVEIKLSRGVQAEEVIDSLYAYTDCESSISVNLLLIKDEKPVQMSVTEIINYHSRKLVAILKSELEIEQKKLLEKKHAKTLERIFIEERIYKSIEKMKSARGVIDAVITGFEPFKNIIKQEVTEDDVEKLLKIPIRRISLYDINKAKEEMEELDSKLKEVKHNLSNIIEFTLGFIAELKASVDKDLLTRKTEFTSFELIAEKEAAKRDIPLFYDKDGGYIGTSVRTGKELFLVSEFDRILIMPKGGFYQVIKVPEKIFIDKGLYFCGIVDKDNMEKAVFTAVYKEKKTGFGYIKRFKVEKFITEKIYPIVKEDSTLLLLTHSIDAKINVEYEPKPRVKILEENFSVNDYLVKGSKAQGTRLANRKIKSVKLIKRK